MENYEFKTTFWQDFTIADKFGTDAIKDTFKRAFKEWKKDYIYLTELVLVLNWICWQHHQENVRYSKLYAKLYEDANDYAVQNLKGKEFDYYFEQVD